MLSSVASLSQNGKQRRPQAGSTRVAASRDEWQLTSQPVSWMSILLDLRAELSVSLAVLKLVRRDRQDHKQATNYVQIIIMPSNKYINTTDTSRTSLQALALHEEIGLLSLKAFQRIAALAGFRELSTSSTPFIIAVGLSVRYILAAEI